MHDYTEFHHQNTINKWRNRLDDIRDWHQQLPETMHTTPSPTIDLTGIRGTTNRIPGGDHLTMLGPYASDATYGDDTPHPTQILTEWAQRIANTTPRTFTAAWRWNRDHTPHILTTPYRNAWTQDIHTLWGRLATLTGNNTPTPETTPTPTTQDIIDALHTNPDHPLTRRELTTILHIPASTITTWRSRGLTPNPDGTYRAGDILNRLQSTKRY